MGRKSIQSKYQPYIDVVMDDLGLTDKVELEWVFGSWRKTGGDAILYSHVFDNGKRWGRVRVDKLCSKSWIIQIIMHELKHIQQYLENKLSVSYIKPHTTKHGKVVFHHYIDWYGVPHRMHGLSNNPKLDKLYKDQPWEKEAYAYQSTYLQVFPNLEIPSKKKLVGVVRGAKFYKTGY